MSEPIKALSLWQPWASLVAVGTKTIETRSWSTKYRGPLAIHAAKRLPEVEMLEDGPAGQLYDDRNHVGAVVCQWWETPEEDFIPERLPIPALRWEIGVVPDFLPVVMPLGAVVATCTLVDVVPMVASAALGIGDCAPDEPLLAVDGLDHELWMYDGCSAWSVEDQRPYGDYSPGRFAWLLDDIEELAEPVPAKGKQGLWNWTPDE